MLVSCAFTVAYGTWHVFACMWNVFIAYMVAHYDVIGDKGVLMGWIDFYLFYNLKIHSFFQSRTIFGRVPTRAMVSTHSYFILLLPWWSHENRWWWDLQRVEEKFQEEIKPFINYMDTARGWTLKNLQRTLPWNLVKCWFWSTLNDMNNSSWYVAF